MSVKRTERGWGAHFIGASKCMFRRNTLLEYKDRKWIVSTVGNYVPRLGDPDSIGDDRWYETMVFEAKMQNGYIDADVCKEIDTDNDWGIWGETWEEVMKTYHTPDNAANDMHERIVDEMTGKIVKDISEINTAQPDVHDTNVGDMISRQAAIDAVRGRFSMPVDNLIVEVIGNLPSAQPERKNGEWQETDKYDIWWKRGYKCSVCGVLTTCAGNFCPNCGADMRGEEC